MSYGFTPSRTQTAGPCFKNRTPKTKAPFSLHYSLLQLQLQDMGRKKLSHFEAMRICDAIFVE